MADSPTSRSSRIASLAWMLALAAVVIFAAGLITGGIEAHQHGEEARDILAFILCRVVSPLIAFVAWGIGFAALLNRPTGLTGRSLCVMLLILIFLSLFCYAAWKGTAAFH